MEPAEDLDLRTILEMATEGQIQCDLMKVFTIDSPIHDRAQNVAFPVVLPLPI